MFYLKIAIIYAILFAITASVILFTSFNNPALSFFIPSIFAMMVYAKLKLGAGKKNVSKHALFCGLIFGLTTLVLVFILQMTHSWLKSPQLMYAIAFGGNMAFPFLLFPKIHNAQG